MIANIKLESNLSIIKKNAKTNKIEEIIKTHNTVVDVGLNQLKNILLNSTQTIIFPTHIALGNSTQTVSSTDTTLDAEFIRDVWTDSADIGTGRVQFNYYFSATQSSTKIAEIGAFNSSSTSTADMYARASIPVDAKTTEQAWIFIWEMAFTNISS